jgi:hypothetical protein
VRINVWVTTGVVVICSGGVVVGVWGSSEVAIVSVAWGWVIVRLGIWDAIGLGDFLGVRIRLGSGEGVPVVKTISSSAPRDGGKEASS